MDVRRKQYGFSMLETLTAIAIVLLLATMVLGLGKRIRIQAQENLCKSEIGIINTAIQQYYNHYRHFPFTTDPSPDEVNGFVQNDLVDTDGISPHNSGIFDVEIGVGSITGAIVYDDYASSEALYYYLYHKFPVSKKLIETIDKSLIACTTDSGRAFWLSTTALYDPPDLDLIRFIDPWGRSLRYTYQAGDAFPVVSSAGADKEFGTADDIVVESLTD